MTAGRNVQRAKEKERFESYTTKTEIMGEDLNSLEHLTKPDVFEKLKKTFPEQFEIIEKVGKETSISFDVYFGYGHKEKGLFWFRFNHNNKGFQIKNTKLHPLLFSERMGNIGFGIGNWHFKWLKKYEG